MPPDGDTSPARSSERARDPGPDPGLDAGAKCGVVLIGHGKTATALLAAARDIIPGEGLEDVLAIDAGLGQTDELTARVCAAIEEVDEGHGVLIIADLMGSSPCMCGIRSGEGHGYAVVAGLNLALLTKLALVDRRQSPRELAEACGEAVHRSVFIKVNDALTPPGQPEVKGCPPS